MPKPSNLVSCRKGNPSCETISGQTEVLTPMNTQLSFVVLYISAVVVSVGGISSSFQYAGGHVDIQANVIFIASQYYGGRYRIVCTLAACLMVSCDASYLFAYYTYTLCEANYSNRRQNTAQGNHTAKKGNLLSLRWRIRPAK